MNSIINKIIEEDKKWYDLEYCLQATRFYSTDLIFAKVRTHEFYMTVVKNNYFALDRIKYQTLDICMAAVKNHGWALQYAKIQTPEICMTAVKNDEFALYYAKVQTPEICVTAIKRRPDVYEYVVLPESKQEKENFIKKLEKLLKKSLLWRLINRIKVSDIIEKILELDKNWRDYEFCLNAVKNSSVYLKYVRKHSLEIYTTAVYRCGWSIQHAKIQTPELCMAAVKKNGFTIRYIKYQTPEICLAAVQEDGLALCYVMNQTPEICVAAIKQNPEAHKCIRLPKDENERDKFLRELGLLLLAM